MRTAAALLLACLLACLLAAVPPALAAWQVDTGAPVPQAVAATAEGHELAVFRRGDRVIMRLRLPDRFVALAAGRCPTFQVDRERPVNGSGGAACTLGERSAEVVLGTIENGRVVSPALYRLMNGRALDYRYITAAGRYREVTFGLERSKRAIRAALGRSLEVATR